VRVPAEGRIAGVCAGIAAYVDTDVTLVRLGWIVLSICPGVFIGGIVAYFAAWLIIPAASAPTHVPSRMPLTRSRVDRKIGGVCGGLAEYLGIDSTVVRVAWAVLSIVPGTIVLGVLAYAVAWFIIPERAAGTMTAAPTTT
jgi:phage shock protein PspC (stress-responsive transcriptional regulator)